VRELSPRIVPSTRHGIRREQFNGNAIKVATQLQLAGYSAFIVGGAVRDLLLGKIPKDFDVVTSATPDEIRALFRRSRIIGRRFRLVHVLCGRDVIEVSTYRRLQLAEEHDDRDVDETGRVLRDNVFGTQPEDALRRDFTINALYYSPVSEEIWDYQGGMADMKAGIIRVMGDPATRYREDPVRMLRAVRLSAKLGFHLEARTRAPIAKMADLLLQVPASRLFDEMLKLFLSGHAIKSVEQLRAEGLHHGLLPLLDIVLDQPQGGRFVQTALQNTDERIKEEKPVSPSFLFAALLWPQVKAQWQQAGGLLSIPALLKAMDTVVHAQTEKLAIPKRFVGVMKEIWSMQPRFAKREGSSPFRLANHPRFKAGYDFFVLRCKSGELETEWGVWWEKFLHADDDGRRALLVMQAPARKRRKRRNRKAREVQGPTPAVLPHPT
jgi:poly(A) polymerase